MTHTAPGRHRAPSRIATALAQGRYTATSTFSVAASGGLLASSILVATTQPSTDFEAAMAALAPVSGSEAASSTVSSLTQDQSEGARDVAAALTGAASAVTLPALAGTVAVPADVPAKAAAAPADAENAPVGELGFVGVTPVVEEPVEEPATESQAGTSTETAAAAPATETASASETRTQSSAGSRSESRAEAPAPEPAPAPQPEPEPAPAPPSGGGEGAIGWAYNHLGLPYIYGSDSGSGFDCSGFVKAAYASAGVSLPHGSSAQYSATSRVSLSNIQRGDLLFYSNGGGIYHVAIYLGDGQVIHSLRDGSGFSGSKVTGMNYSPGLFAAGRP